MHQLSMGQCIEKHKMLQKSHHLQKTTLSSLCALTSLNKFMFFLDRQTVAKYNSDDLI